MMRILIVERDRDTTDALLQIFEAEGWRADSAADTHRALSLLEEARFYDAVLLDLSLPLTEELAFLREKQRRAAISTIPVVAMTADVGVPDAIEGVVRVLRKPFPIGFAMAAICHAAAYGPGSGLAASGGPSRRA